MKNDFLVLRTVEKVKVMPGGNYNVPRLGGGEVVKPLDRVSV